MDRQATELADRKCQATAIDATTSSFNFIFPVSLVYIPTFFFGFLTSSGRTDKQVVSTGGPEWETAQIDSSSWIATA
ncbi:MAG: hypothetical protein ACYSW3_29825, partial [Planctomycetota bacterium]